MEEGERTVLVTPILLLFVGMGRRAVVGVGSREGRGVWVAPYLMPTGVFWNTVFALTLMAEALELVELIEKCIGVRLTVVALVALVTYVTLGFVAAGLDVVTAFGALVVLTLTPSTGVGVLSLRRACAV